MVSDRVIQVSEGGVSECRIDAGSDLPATSHTCHSTLRHGPGAAGIIGASVVLMRPFAQLPPPIVASVRIPE